MLLPVAAMSEGRPPALNGAALAAFFYVTVVATAIAFVAWFSGLRHLPAASVGMIGLLNPVAGVVLGIGVAGERLALPQFAGLVVVVAAVLVERVVRTPPRRHPVGIEHRLGPPGIHEAEPVFLFLIDSRKR
jgi:probable blue pigment (indigoidine) exporter